MASFDTMGTQDEFDCTFPSSPSSSDYSSDSYSPHSSNSSLVSFLSSGSLSLKKDSANFEDCFPHSSQHSSSDHSASGNSHWHSGEHSPSSGRRKSKSSKSGKSRKRRHDTHHHHQFHQRHAANMRERKRMQSINDAFEVSIYDQCFLYDPRRFFLSPQTFRVFDSTFPPYRMRSVYPKWTHFDWPSGTLTFSENWYAQAALRCS